MGTVSIRREQIEKKQSAEIKESAETKTESS